MQWKTLVVWISFALVALVAAFIVLNGSFPLFSFLWLAAPLIAVLRGRDAGRVGFRRVAPKELAWVTAVNLAVVLALMAAFEPWSHTYQHLLELVLAAPQPDTTFAWLVRYPGPAGYVGMFVYSGLVTLFAEELCFRGWLLGWLRARVGTAWAVVLQAAAFTLPNLIVAVFLQPLQGVLYALVYTWLAIGVVGGWAAARTRSIWPGLITATLCNLILTVSLLPTM
jgi:membrane protease YdiL (CAAX protease family)